MIRLSPEAEPEIYATANRFGTVLENVVIDEKTRELDLERRDAHRKHARGLSDLLHPERVASEGRAAIRRTSSC